MQGSREAVFIVKKSIEHVIDAYHYPPVMASNATSESGYFLLLSHWAGILRFFFLKQIIEVFLDFRRKIFLCTLR